MKASILLAILILLSGCAALGPQESTGPVVVEDSEAGYCALTISVHTDEPVKLYSDYTNNYVEANQSQAIIEATPGGYVRAEYWRNGSTIWNRTVKQGCSVTEP